MKKGEKLKTIKSFDQFAETREQMSIEKYDEKIGSADYEHVEDEIKYYHVYRQGVLTELKSGKFYVLFNREEYEVETLKEAEQLLWDGFSKREIGLSDEEIESDMHERCRILMRDLEKKHGLLETELSLDDFQHKYNGLLDDKDKEKCEYMLNLFYNQV